MNILITGGAGYVGSHVAKAIYLAGMTPVVLDDLSTGHEEAVKFGPFVCSTLLNDPVKLISILLTHHIEAVIHCAGSTSVAESMVKPGAYFQNNITGTLNLLTAMQEVGIKDIVFSSSAAVYGFVMGNMASEGHPTSPLSPYGESKKTVETLLAHYPLRSICLRYFNVAGADPEGQLGENHRVETHLIPLAIDAALTQRPLRLNGTDYSTPDGTAIRDYIHVSDLADAHVLALQSLGGSSVPRSQRVNIGSGRGWSVREVIKIVEEVTHQRIMTLESPRRDGDPPVLIADIRTAWSLLRWVPTRPLHTMVEDALRWVGRRR